MNKKSTLNRFFSFVKNSLPGLAILAVGLLGANEGMAQKYAMKGWGDARSGFGYGSVGNGSDTIVYNAFNIYTDTGWGGKFIQLSAGTTHTLGIKENGSLWAWGNNADKQLGIPSVTSYVTSPMLVDSGKNVKWRMISAGGVHSLALKEDSTLWAWGRNSEYQYGNNTTTAYTVPTKLTDTMKWASVTAWGMSTFNGYFFVNLGGGVGIKADGSVWAWGSYGNQSSLGDGGSTSSGVPKQIQAGKFKKIAAGQQGHFMALKEDSTLWAWGWNSAGQIGNGISSGATATAPMQIGFGTKWLDVSPGHVHTMAIKADGSLWGWGSANNYRRDTTFNTAYTPIIVDGGNNGKWARVYAGFDYSYAVKEDGTIWRWGNNTYGMMGDGNPNNFNYAQKYMLKLQDSLVTLDGFSLATRQYQVLISGYWKIQCVATKPVLKSVGASAVISWPRKSVGKEYEVVIDQSNTLSPTGNPISTTDTFYNSGNTLNSFQKYYAHVRTHCGFGNYSAWDTVQFTAPFICRTPKAIAAIVVGNDSATINWNKADSVVRYEVVVDQSATVIPTGTTANVTDTFHKTGSTLNPDEVYYVHIRTVCKSGGNSDWDTISFRTLPVCVMPADLAVSNVTEDSAFINWKSTAASLQYEIAIDQSATLAPTAAPTQTTDTFYLTGTTLSANTTYYAHLRANCDNNNNSAWDTVKFTTPPPAGVKNYNNIAGSVVVYPNPAITRLYVRAQVDLTANIYSTDGKAVIEAATIANGIDINDLASGVYFVQLKNTDGVTVKTVRFTKAAK